MLVARDSRCVLCNKSLQSTHTRADGALLRLSLRGQIRCCLLRTSLLRLTLAPHHHGSPALFCERVNQGSVYFVMLRLLGWLGLGLKVARSR